MSRRTISVRSLSELAQAMRAAAARDCDHARTSPLAAGGHRCQGCGRVFSWSEYADLTEAQGYSPARELPRGLVPAGDLPPCACGKRSYADEAAAITQSRVLARKATSRIRVYRCHLGLPVFHVISAVSSRQRTGR
jgi:hypothetical protein